MEIYKSIEMSIFIISDLLNWFIKFSSVAWILIY